MTLHSIEKNHVHAIETARHKNIYDHVTEYQTFLLETQGKAEFEEFIHEMNVDIF